MFNVAWHVAVEEAVGSRLYVSMHNPRRVWKRDGHEWMFLESSYLPYSEDGTFIYSFDDGSGPKPYILGYYFAPTQTGYFVWSARWTGTSWERMPDAFWFYSTPFRCSPHTSADLGMGSRVYGTGFFAGGGPHGVSVARWDGDHWTEVGRTPDGSSIHAMIGYNDGSGPALYVFGQFTAISGVLCDGFAKWDGSSWIGLPGVVNNFEGDCAVYDDGSGPALFTTWRPVGNPSGLNRWNGKQWTHIGRPTIGGFSFRHLGVFDDGRGAALYVAGGFQDFNGVLARNIVRWDGQAFEPLGAGTNFDGGWGLSAYTDGSGDSLLVGGVVSSAGAGAGTVSGAAIWTGCPNCYANCDLSTFEPRLNVSDFICFLNKFAARDPYANCTVDAAIDINDFICFLNKYSHGCP